MATVFEQSTSAVQSLEQQIQKLENELKDKNQRLEKLEAAVSADGDSLAQLETLERFEADWNREHELLDNERDEELRLLQEALEEALEEKADLESKMVRDASRESQLLDDFEWKLGEIEREYKKKLAEAEKAAEDRAKKEMAAEYQRVIDDRRDIDEKLTAIAHLKSYEAEATQLRGLIHEQQRAIRVAARQIEQLRNDERQLNEDLRQTKIQGCTRKQQQEMEEKWEEKTQMECNRLRAELLAANEEEMLKTIRQVVREKDDIIISIKRQLEAQQLAFNHQLTELKNEKEKWQQQEAKLTKQLEAARTAADRDLCELRRQLSKTEDSNTELVEKIQQQHIEELERCQMISRENCAALERSYEEKLQSLEMHHNSQLISVQELFEEEKQEALTELGDHYQVQLTSLKDHIDYLQKRLNELDKVKQEEAKRLQETIEQQREEIDVLLHRPLDPSKGEDGSECSTSADDDDDSSSEDEEESSPPTGRSAGDGCSPSASAASQDNLRPCLESPIPPVHEKLATKSPVASELMRSHAFDRPEQDRSGAVCCDDPEHIEAQQIILEMHQVLADRDAELQRLTEEKRFYQLELIHWERNLALQRAGLPLALIPDRYCSEADLNPWRGFSAPPVTKPRLPDNLHFPPAAMYGNSRAASYEMYSPSVISLSPEGHDVGQPIFSSDPTSTLLLPSGSWLPIVTPDIVSVDRHLHRTIQDSNYYYSDEDA